MTDPIDIQGARYAEGWKCGRDSRRPPRTMSPEYRKGYEDALEARRWGRRIEWSAVPGVVVDLDDELRLVGVTG